MNYIDLHFVGRLALFGMVWSVTRSKRNLSRCVCYATPTATRAIRQSKVDKDVAKAKKYSGKEFKLTMKMKSFVRHEMLLAFCSSFRYVG